MVQCKRKVINQNHQNDDNQYGQIKTTNNFQTLILNMVETGQGSEDRRGDGYPDPETSQ